MTQKAKPKNKRNARQTERRNKLYRAKFIKKAQQRRLESLRYNIQQVRPANLTKHQRSRMNREAREYAAEQARLAD